MATIFQRSGKKRRAAFNYDDTPETKTKKAVKNHLETLFGRHIFILPIAGGQYQKSGSPDWIVSLRGKFIAMEIKAFKEFGGRPRLGEKQREMLEDIKFAGAIAGVVDSWEALAELVKDFEPVQKCIFQTGGKL